MTVIVVPRERFAVAEASLQSLLATAAPPFDIVYFDAGGPSGLQCRLDELQARPGFRRLRPPRPMLPNAARNLAVRDVTTELVVFVDNDVRFESGWLTELVACADETGADLVAPLYLMGPDADPRVHGAASSSEVVEDGGGRRWRYGHPYKGTRLAEVPPLERSPCSLIEFHCVLARRSTLLEVGPLDEGLRVLEHNDLSMAVMARGGTIMFEPRSRVTWMAPQRIAPSDLPFFLVRWSQEGVEASARRFASKWGVPLDDPGIVAYPRENARHRARYLLPVRKGLRVVLGTRLGDLAERRLLLPLEVRVNRAFAPPLERRRWARPA